MKKIITLSLITVFGFVFSACDKKPASTSTPTIIPTPRLIEIAPQDRPYISLIPRADGHELKLKINQIPQNISQIEYELLYTAVDEGNEIEKGVGDTIKVTSANIERDLLLGTASCTNGCKYKYDTGINGGTLSLTFVSQTSQISTFQTPFTLASALEVKKTKSITLPTEKFTINLETVSNEFFVLLKNYQPGFSLFSSGQGKGKIKSIEPSSISKTDMNTISGDYR